jgi:hypothetical protein
MELIASESWALLSLFIQQVLILPAAFDFEPSLLFPGPMERQVGLSSRLRLVATPSRLVILTLALYRDLKSREASLQFLDFFLIPVVLKVIKQDLLIALGMRG